MKNKQTSVCPIGKTLSSEGNTFTFLSLVFHLSVSLSCVSGTKGLDFHFISRLLKKMQGKQPSGPEVLRTIGKSPGAPAGQSGGPPYLLPCQSPQLKI